MWKIFFYFFLQRMMEIFCFTVTTGSGRRDWNNFGCWLEQFYLPALQSVKCAGYASHSYSWLHRLLIANRIQLGYAMLRYKLLAAQGVKLCETLPLLNFATFNTSWQTLLKYMFIHSFIHSGYFYSAPSSPLLLGGAPDYSTDTVSEFHDEAHRQLQVQDLPKVSTWRLEWESNPRPTGWKSSSQPRCHHVPQFFLERGSYKFIY